MRLLLGLIALATSAVVGCGVDSYLTCGAACDDGGVDATTPDASDASADGSPSDAGSDGKPSDAGSDVAQETGCQGAYCQSSGSCCGTSPACTAGHRCATSCGGVDASCSSQPDTCCPNEFCTQGRCSACIPSDAGCSEDNQCCSGSCNGSTCK